MVWMKGMFSAMLVPTAHWKFDMSRKTTCTTTVENRNRSMAKLLVSPSAIGKKHVPNVTASSRLMNTANVMGAICELTHSRSMIVIVDRGVRLQQRREWHRSRPGRKTRMRLRKGYLHVIDLLYSYCADYKR